ncbi:MAG: Fic family protein [Chlamydiae bacterium]|nr:Fic family protein [Chlamydiota bacterium]
MSLRIMQALGYQPSLQIAPSPSKASFSAPCTLSLGKIAKIALASFSLVSGSSIEAKADLSSRGISIVYCSREKTRPEPTADLSFQLFSGDVAAQPLSSGPIHHFPHDLCQRATQLGVYLLADGRSGCDFVAGSNSSGIGGEFPNPKECRERVKEIKKDVEEQMLRPMRNSCPHRTQYHIEDGHPITDVSFHMSPERMVACTSSYGYIQDSFLHNIKSAVKHLSSTQILDLLLGIHSTAYHGDLEGGKFRDAETHIDFGPFAKKLHKMGASEEDFKTLQSIYDFQDRSNLSIDQMIPFFSDKQLAVLSRVAIIPPSPTVLKKYLRVFARKLSERLGDVLSHKVDAITVAAWAHQQILRMHPFMDGNARVARVMLNTILQVGGYEAVGFPSEKDFYDNMKEPKQFRDYLAKVVLWNQSQRSSLKV